MSLLRTRGLAQPFLRFRPVHLHAMAGLPMTSATLGSAAATVAPAIHSQLQIRIPTRARPAQARIAHSSPGALPNRVNEAIGSFRIPTRSGVQSMIPRYAFLPALLLAASFLTLPAIADQPAPAAVQLAQAESELDFWNSIKDSKKAEDYQRYLDKYPDGDFADLAKLRMKKYAPAAAPPPPPPPPPPAAVDPQQADIAYWNSIKASKNVEDYKAYLEKYPNGEFVDLAKLRVEQYGAPAAAPAKPPVPPASAEPKAAEPKAAEPAAAEPQEPAAPLPATTPPAGAELPATTPPAGAELPATTTPAGAELPATTPPAGQLPTTTPPAGELPTTTQPTTTQPASVEPSPSPAPAQALTFEAKDATVYARNGGQVRAAPDPHAALVTKLKTNTEVHATGLSSDGKWWRVELPDGQGGYMHASVVSQRPVSRKKSSTGPAAAPAGPDAEVCPAPSQTAPNDRVAACERLVAKADDDQAKLAALNDLAAALAQAHRTDDAIRKYEQAADLAPRDASIYYRIGLVRLDQLRFPEARAAFEKAAQLDPQNPDIVFQRGNSYIGVGDFEKGKLEVERALLTPNDAAAYYEKLGEINIARGDLESAKVALERGRKADPERHSLILAAVNYLVGAQDIAASQAAAAMSEPTAALWNTLIKKAKGDAAGAGQGLETGRATYGDDWPGPVFDALSGTLSLAKARAAAKSRDPNTQFEQLCALNFFAGEWAYLSGDKDAARAALQAALATRAYWTLEFAAAKARLANMGG
jgi:Flp pilus assembly protein TadD